MIISEFCDLKPGDVIKSEGGSWYLIKDGLLVPTEYGYITAILLFRDQSDSRITYELGTEWTISAAYCALYRKVDGSDVI